MDLLRAAGASITIDEFGGVEGTLDHLLRLPVDRVKIDDPVGAVSVHGVCGAFGTIMVGLFSATESDGIVKKGLFYGGGTDQLVSQVIGVVSVGAFVLVTSWILFTVLKATVGLRVDDQEEIEGLDVHEHGFAGYSNAD